jgi:hypothetical protein
MKKRGKNQLKKQKKRTEFSRITYGISMLINLTLFFINKKAATRYYVYISTAQVHIYHEKKKIMHCVV